MTRISTRFAAALAAVFIATASIAGIVHVPHGGSNLIAAAPGITLA